MFCVSCYVTLNMKHKTWNMISYLQINWIEIVGAILSLIYLYLSIKQQVSLWFFGIISSLFYIVVFFQSKLFADMSLQFYYVVISIYGWIHWKTGKSVAEDLPVTRINTKYILVSVVATVVFYLLYYYILVYFKSNVPKSDALVGALSIVGTWMLARKFLENWLVWMLADGLCIGLYIYKGLYPTVILFVIYTVMTVVGYWQWKKTI